MTEIEEKRITCKNINSSLRTVDDVIREVLKTSPRLNTKRQDLQRGVSYYITGGDPDKRNQI